MTEQEQYINALNGLKNADIKIDDEIRYPSIKAIEKQVAKKVISVKPYGHNCECGHYFDNRAWHSRYCGYCGQKLDWGNEDEY